MLALRLGRVPAASLQFVPVATLAFATPGSDVYLLSNSTNYLNNTSKKKKSAQQFSGMKL